MNARHYFEDPFPSAKHAGSSCCRRLVKHSLNLSRCTDARVHARLLQAEACNHVSIARRRFVIATATILPAASWNFQRTRRVPALSTSVCSTHKDTRDTRRRKVNNAETAEERENDRRRRDTRETSYSAAGKVLRARLVLIKECTEPCSWNVDASFFEKTSDSESTGRRMETNATTYA